jgi:hypothetical protein
MIKSYGDIDIDLADRNLLLQHIDAIPAAIRDDSRVRKHNTGIYPTDIPYDPINNTCAIDYTQAEARGYIKLDLLNISLYKQVKDETHLVELMREPLWELLLERSFFEQLIHVGRHYDAMINMPEPINSIPRMAMFLAIIRPAKKHLIGQAWSEVAKTIWDKEVDGYQFKKAHGIAYANLVVVNMNLLMESIKASALQE